MIKTEKYNRSEVAKTANNLRKKGYGSLSQCWKEAWRKHKLSRWKKWRAEQDIEEPNNTTLFAVMINPVEQARQRKFKLNI